MTPIELVGALALTALTGAIAGWGTRGQVERDRTASRPATVETVAAYPYALARRWVDAETTAAKAEVKALRRMLFAAVLAGGGTLRVPEEYQALLGGPLDEWESQVQREVVTGDTLIHVRRRASKASGAG